MRRLVLSPRNPAQSTTREPWSAQMNTKELHLVRPLQQGDKDACRQLIDRYSNKSYGVALRLMKEPMEAEEVLQETFIAACNAVEEFEGRSSLGTWLYRIATNNSLMRLRSQPEGVVSLDPSIEPDMTLLPQQLNAWPEEPEQVALDQELRRVMEAAVEELSASLRAAFVLRDLQGLSTAEAAEALGISESAVKVRLHRARLELRETLAAYFNQEGDA